jgi:hypothetical protein
MHTFLLALEDERALVISNIKLTIKKPRFFIGSKYAMMLMKVFLANILLNFNVSTKQSRDDIQVVHGILLETTSPILLTLTTSN